MCLSYISLGYTAVSDLRFENIRRSDMFSHKIFWEMFANIMAF